jgi:hypothetical protein
VLALQTPAASGAATGHISETYVLNWSANIYSTNGNGKITITPFSSQDVVRKILSDSGIAYSSAYTLVYRPDKRDTVVMKINDPFPYTFTPADYLQIQDSFTDFQNIYGTWTVKQAFISDEHFSGFLGSLAGFEYSVKNSSGYRTSYSFSGNFQFVIPDNSDIWPQGVYVGTFSTGSKIWSHDL